MSSFSKKNFIHFERFVCVSRYKNVQVQCRAKYIDRRNLKVNAWVNLTEPVKSAWFDSTVSYKYTIHWHQIGQFRMDVCGYLNGTAASYMLDFFLPRVVNYTNLNHPCPYSGVVFFKTNNISAQVLSLPQILPAGRYRFHSKFITPDSRKADKLYNMYNTTLFFSVSDRRIEIV